MKTSFFPSLFLCAIASLAVAAPRACAARTSIAFSDPSTPGQLVVRQGFGDLTIAGTDTKEIVVNSGEAVKNAAEPRTDGLRRLDGGGGGFLFEEKNNVVTVTLADLLGGGRHGRHDSDVTIEVPASTRVTLERGGPGDVSISKLSGDVEVRGAIGDVALEGVSGGVLVESVNGDVVASFAALSATQPVSITVVHGDVNLNVPATAKANVRFRTLRGEMLTDFAESELKTNMENAGAMAMSEDDVAGDEAERAVDQAMAEHDRALAEADRARAEADRARAEAGRVATMTSKDGRQMTVHAPVDLDVNVHVPPIPPIPPLPPMAGGKLVVGTLNGGGADLIVTTLTGDITLRKVAK